MIRTASLIRTATAALVFTACALPTPARAESDYEFARTLMDLNSSSYSTDDLVQRLAARLEEAPASKSEATLIKAALKRRQAGDATPEKRVTILKDASELYKEVVAGDKKFRLYATAQKDAESVRKETILALIENSKGKPAEAKKYRTEAAAMFGKEAGEFKTEAESYYPKFKTAFDAFTKQKTAIDPQGDNGKMPGREVMEPLEKNFDGWIIADKKYVALKLEEIEAMDETDGGRKKLATDMIEHCKKRTQDEVLMDFPVITSRYSYLQGRFSAAIGDEEGAKAAWKEALEVDAQTLPDDQKKQILGIRKLIIHDLVKMLVRNKKFSEVEDIVLGIKTDPTTRSILQEDAGKELMIDYAKAVAANAETAGDYERALKEVHEMLLKEKLGSTWSNSFSRAMADVLLDARAKKVRPHLTAVEWYDAARGFHLMGRFIYTQQYERLLKSPDPKERAEAPAKFEEAYKEYANSVDYYRRAIAEARQSDRTSLATRLDIEPKAWFEMGLSYMRMKQDYEAIIAYKAMRDSFLPDSRIKWMPDPKKESKAYTKQVNAALATLDLPKEKEGMLAKSGINILIALEENEKAHKDPWNQGLKPKIISLGKDPLDPDSVNDQEYILADGDAKSARSLADSARKEVSAENADTLWAQAFAKYNSAAEKFAKVKPASTAYDFGLIQSANNYTQAQQVVADGHGPNKMTKAAEEQSKELALKALAAYKAYEDYESKNPSTDEKILARRKQFRNVSLLAKNSLFTSSGNWEEAVKSADEYIAWESENPTTSGKSSAPIAYLNKFRAQLALAAGNSAPASDPYLKGALVSLRNMRDVNKGDKKLNTYMLSALSDRYNVAAFQLENKKKTDSNLSKDDQEKLDTLINSYEKKVADLQGERVDLMEGGDELTLDDYSRLVYLFHRTGNIRKATDTAIKLLKKFDPENKNMKMADDEQTWKPFLDGMLRAIEYPSIEKDKRAKLEHTMLVDYMYDTAAGAQLPENDKRRPANDLFNENMEKALDKLNSIRNPKGDFADVKTLRVSPKAGGKPYLAIVEDEIQFRRKIAAARDLLSDMALEVADKLRKDGNEEKSNEYLEVAKQQIKILQDLNSNQSAAIEVKVAEIDIALGKVTEAMNRLNDIKGQVPADSMLYFIISRRIAELYATQNKWKEAAEFPEFIAVTAGFNNKMVKERWPGMEAFLKSCYEHGVKMPDALRKKFEASAASATEGAATEAPKPEAPAAPVPAVTEKPKP